MRRRDITLSALIRMGSSAEEIRLFKATKEEDTRDQRLVKEYGITVAQYDAMLVRQGGSCAICRKPPTGRRLAVDHAHDERPLARRVRGLLCFPCNKFLVGRHTRGTAEKILAYLASDFDGRDLPDGRVNRRIPPPPPETTRGQVVAFIAGRESVTTQEMVEAGLTPCSTERAATMLAAACLHNLGWRKRRVSRNGKQENVFFPPKVSPHPPMLDVPEVVLGELVD